MLLEIIQIDKTFYGLKLNKKLKLKIFDIKNYQKTEKLLVILNQKLFFI